MSQILQFFFFIEFLPKSTNDNKQDLKTSKPIIDHLKWQQKIKKRRKQKLKHRHLKTSPEKNVLRQFSFLFLSFKLLRSIPNVVKDTTRASNVFLSFSRSVLVRKSANVSGEKWVVMAKLIADYYRYTSFVISIVRCAMVSPLTTQKIHFNASLLQSFVVGPSKNEDFNYNNFINAKLQLNNFKYVLQQFGFTFFYSRCNCFFCCCLCHASVGLLFSTQSSLVLVHNVLLLMINRLCFLFAFFNECMLKIASYWRWSKEWKDREGN